MHKAFSLLVESSHWQYKFPLPVERPVNTAISQTKVQHQRPTTHGVNKAHLPIRRPINLRPSPQASAFHQKVTTVKTNQVNAVKGVKGNWGNPQHALKDKGVIDSKSKRWVLVTKPHNKTPYELLLGRTHSIGFMRPFACLVTILNTLDPLGKFDRKADEGFLVGYSNTDADVAFDIKEPESEVHVSLSSSDKTKKHDEKTKREAKGNSHVDLSIGVRNLSDEFEDFSSNNTNRVNAASAPVTAVGLNSTNNTNSFNAASPSDNVVSPT
nr:retrovirus-related Pol polyprotein from transposon TNT 1-94 [Tanacetum cinerariifolium]